ncbi:MAG: MYXO-CTERM sorting domain-containing protein [Polyangiaceae bacterium]
MRRVALRLSGVSLLWVIGCSDSSAPLSAASSQSQETVASQESALGGAARSRTRHSKRFSPNKKPDGVPNDYVLTRSGFMHPSCVVRLEPDESVSHDGSIHGPDGAVRDVLSPCAYERFAADGQPLARNQARPPHRPHATYDGWVAYYVYDGSVAAGTTITTDWVVPASPITKGSQDIAFFNDIITEKGSNIDILQPVLDYNSGVWSTESEHCCINDNDVYSDGGQVAVGDTIRGIVKGTSCSSDGSCSTWTITTQDLTKGSSTTLTVTNAVGAPTSVHPAVLETYDVTTCAMLPASGKETFFNNSVTSSSSQSLTYKLGVISAAEAPSGFPKCGYSGTSSGESYTLIFSTTTGGTSGSGGAASTGGSSASGGVTSAGGTSSTGGARSMGGTSSGGASSSGGGSAARGGTTSAGGTSSGASGGLSASGGSVGSGGSVNSGGSATSGGAANSGGLSSSGGSLTSGGSSSNGGSLSSGGSSSNGGSVGSGGAAGASSGGASGQSGATAFGGSSAAGGSAGVAGANTGGATSSVQGSCSCSVPGKQSGSSGRNGGAVLLGLLGMTLLRRRRRG